MMDRKPSPEGKVARHLKGKGCFVQALEWSKRKYLSNFCGAVTKEGKRTCPLADYRDFKTRSFPTTCKAKTRRLDGINRAAWETFRLPSSVNALGR